LRPSKE